MSVRIGVDIGGTFTDIVAVVGNKLFSAKVPTNAQDLPSGVRQAVQQVLYTTQVAPDTVVRFVHGTTIATNAVLEEKGSKTALLTTAGFEDILEIGRLQRSKLYDPFMDAETPTFLAPRHRRYGIRERVDSEGSVLQPLDEDSVTEAIRDAVREGCEAYAVSYLFAFMNPAHEERTLELIRELVPEASVSLSSIVHPVFREYERTVVTAFDAFIRPKIAQYIAELQQTLSTMDIPAHLQVMQGRGGVAGYRSVVEKPVTTLLSGPAAGVIGGRYEGQRSGFSDVITLDMGGTSCDVALVHKGTPLITTQGRIGTHPLQIPMVDVSTVGAGGGSIAWVDAAGSLKVGPQSAGAQPGPACYGRGGTAATVTDASVVLGYLNPEYFAGGTLQLNADAAEQAVRELAHRVELSPIETALGIHRIVNARMVDQIRLMSVRRGFDPRRFALVLLGGAGPLHGGLLAAELGIPNVVIPPNPGVLSAFGLLVAPVEYDHTHSFAARTSEADLTTMRTLLRELDAVGHEKMIRDGVDERQIRALQYAEMRYVGQSYEIEVPLPSGVSAKSVLEAVQRFHDLHKAIYGHSANDAPVEFVTLRVVHSADVEELSVSSITSSQSEQPKATRRAAFPGTSSLADVPIFDRSSLEQMTVQGPAIIEQADTTTVVYPGQNCRVDAAGNLILQGHAGRE